MEYRLKPIIPSGLFILRSIRIKDSESIFFSDIEIVPNNFSKKIKIWGYNLKKQLISFKF